MVSDSVRPVIRPNIFAFHDYREYLLAWIEFKKLQDPKFSLRTFSDQVGVSPAYISMVTKGLRPLSLEALKKTKKVISLSASESSFLRQLMILADSTDPQEKTQALRRIQKFKEYKEIHAQEFETFRYMTKWYYVAIRELALRTDFVADPFWIQKQFRLKLSIKQIEEGLEFLQAHGFVTIDKKGRATARDKNIDCLGGVFKLSLASFHKQMFENAAASIHNATAKERLVLGHTFLMSGPGYDQAATILQEAFAKIQELEQKDVGADRLYHVGFSAFPMTKPTDK